MTIPRRLAMTAAPERLTMSAARTWNVDRRGLFPFDEKSIQKLRYRPENSGDGDLPDPVQPEQFRERCGFPKRQER
ncbi:hypothetical protein [Mycoplana azooxidifex]|nr:hypothetical protein [Mycoplana azooxidifex]